LIKVEGNQDEVDPNYIDHMFLDDTTYSGEEWLFGTTRSIKFIDNGKKVVLWKIKLDSSHNPILTDTSVAASFHI
jgi:hypothetical protein